MEWTAESVAAEREEECRDAANYLPFGFRFAFGLALSAFNAAKGWSLGSGGVIS